jgi:DNA invertase Pin-like site-specific DNA recombinase
MASKLTDKEREKLKEALRQVKAELDLDIVPKIEALSQQTGALRHLMRELGKRIG